MTNIISYDTYLKTDAVKDPTNTNEYPTPETAVVPPPGDKVIAYMRSQFISQSTYFNVGIRSTNKELPNYKNDGTK